MCSSDAVRKVGFTGSTRVGKLLFSQAAETMKKVSPNDSRQPSVSTVHGPGCSCLSSSAYEQGAAIMPSPLLPSHEKR